MVVCARNAATLGASSRCGLAHCGFVLGVPGYKNSIR